MWLDRKSALARPRISSGQSTGTGKRDARHRVGQVMDVGGRRVDRVTQILKSGNDALMGQLRISTGSSQSKPVARMPQANEDESNDRVGRELNIADTSVDPETKMLKSGNDALIVQVVCDEEVRTRRETNYRAPKGTADAGLYVSPRGHLVLQDLRQRRASEGRKSALARPRIASGTSTGSDLRGETRTLAGKALNVGGQSIDRATMISKSDNDTVIQKIEPGVKTVTAALQ